jgi:hypothetical protein
MSSNTPFTVIRDFLDSLPQSTRDDVMSHVLMKHMGLAALENLEAADTYKRYDKYFSDATVSDFEYLGRVLSLRAFIDHHIWAFSDDYNVKKQERLMKIVEEKPMTKETIRQIKESWANRSSDLKDALPKWEDLKNGPLSNIAITEYSNMICARSLPDQAAGQ